MTARFLHFGLDDCHRIAVLRGAGYDVIEAYSPSDLRAHLRTGQFNAVLISEDGENEPIDILRAVRCETSAPVLLFRSTYRDIDQRGFAGVIQPLDRPAEWLCELSSLFGLGPTRVQAAD
jgi:hypothetical protein